MDLYTSKQVLIDAERMRNTAFYIVRSAGTQRLLQYGFSWHISVLHKNVGLPNLRITCTTHAQCVTSGMTPLLNCTYREER